MASGPGSGPGRRNGHVPRSLVGRGAGLVLSALEAHPVRCPHRNRSPWLRPELRPGGGSPACTLSLWAVVAWLGPCASPRATLSVEEGP